jgi:hypothetical protein
VLHLCSITPHGKWLEENGVYLYNIESQPFEISFVSKKRIRVIYQSKRFRINAISKFEKLFQNPGEFFPNF